MLGLQMLEFQDRNLEASFRKHWDESSRTLLVLLSLLTGLIWVVATSNVHMHCHWSRSLCLILESICTAIVVFHFYIQYQLRAHPGEAPYTNTNDRWTACLTSNHPGALSQANLCSTCCYILHAKFVCWKLSCQ